VDTIAIDVLPWNEAGLRFWEKLGFTPTCIVWLSEKTDRIAQPVDSLLQPVKALAGIITRGICRSSLRSAES